MKIIKILLGFIIFIFLISNAYAFGIATPFASGEDVYIPAGESKEFTFSIQNGAGAIEEVNTKVEILDGNEIASIIGENEYLVPAGGERSLKVMIKVPESATKDDKWHVELSAKTINPSKKGTVGMGYGVITGFDVVTKEPIKVETTGEKVVEEVGYTNFLFALVFVVIVVIIIYLLEKRNKTKGKKK